MCHKKTKFISIGMKKIKGKNQVVLGRYKCSHCDWQSELQEPDQQLAIPIRPKNPVYMYHHYFKEDKTLSILVYTTEKIIDSSNHIFRNLDRHLLTIEVSPNSLKICPNVPFSIQKKRLEEGLMFLQDNKELVASPCSECSEDQKNDCLHNKEPCNKMTRT